MERRKILHKILLFLTMALFLSACDTPDKEEADSEYYLYYIDKEETKVVPEAYTPENTTVEGMIDEFVEALDKNSDNVDNRKAKPDNVGIIGAYMDGKLLYISFDTGYYDMSAVREILFRTVVVRQFIQIPEIEYVSIYINDRPLTDSAGNTIGILTEDNFVENIGEELDSYKKDQFTLYFANETGDKLIEESLEVVYSNNISKEKVIIEQLIKGPEMEGVYQTLSPNTKLLSVSTKDNICYVNFDEGFLEQTGDLAGTIPIYSVVNSLSEITGINKVQISINGNTDRNYRESISLDTTFERNLDIVETSIK